MYIVRPAVYRYLLARAINGLVLVGRESAAAHLPQTRNRIYLSTAPSVIYLCSASRPELILDRDSDTFQTRVTIFQMELN